MKVGIEIGGTFTDLVAFGPRGVVVAKVPSVPSAPEEGVFHALEAAGIAISEVDDLVHGSTVATNAVLERKGGRTGLVTTAGFTDVLLIQRQDRNRTYDLHYRKPVPVVSRRDVLGLKERLLPDGEIAVPLRDGWEEALVEYAKRGAYDAIAVSLLNAYANPVHEIAVRRVLKERFPGLHVTCSHEVCREFREYERTSTATLSAYVQPVMDRYLTKFESRLKEGGFSGSFSMMQSNGGRRAAAAVRTNAVSALFSGPAAGVAGAVEVARRAGFPNVITLDIGGTSTDVCLITNGQPVTAPGTLVEGLPVRTPAVDIATIGAGGGSLVRRDEGGMLHVGPRSSGAMPGPACYGRGGTLPTVTDAHVVRGTLRPEMFLGGRMALDIAAARDAFGPLAEAFAVSVEQMADNAIRLANANIVAAIQQISTQLGIDPRDYVLVPYGGAGPLHAGRVAEELGIATILVPQDAGVLSAMGLVVSDYKQFEVDTQKITLGEDAVSRLAGLVRAQKARIRSDFARTGVSGEIIWSVALQMRLIGQAFEIDVEVDDPETGVATLEGLRGAFSDAYHRIYASTVAATTGIEIVGVRLGGSVGKEIKIPRPAPGEASPSMGPVSIFEEREFRECRSVRRSDLDGETVGPVIVADATSTLYVPPLWQAEADAANNLILRRHV